MLVRSTEPRKQFTNNQNQSRSTCTNSLAALIEEAGLRRCGLAALCGPAPNDASVRQGFSSSESARIPNFVRAMLYGPAPADSSKALQDLTRRRGSDQNGQYDGTSTGTGWAATSSGTSPAGNTTTAVVTAEF
jgi:hypothetical protein